MMTAWHPPSLFIGADRNMRVARRAPLRPRRTKGIAEKWFVQLLSINNFRFTRTTSVYDKKGPPLVTGFVPEPGIFDCIETWEHWLTEVKGCHDSPMKNYCIWSAKRDRVEETASPGAASRRGVAALTQTEVYPAGQGLGEGHAGSARP